MEHSPKRVLSNDILLSRIRREVYMTSSVDLSKLSDSIFKAMSNTSDLSTMGREISMSLQSDEVLFLKDYSIEDLYNLIRSSYFDKALKHRRTGDEESLIYWIEQKDHIFRKIADSLYSELSISSEILQ